MSDVTKLVLIWIREGQERAYRTFERAAQQGVERHGGRILHEWPVDDWEGDDLQRRPPHEVHLVRFENEDAYLAYQADPEILKSQSERDAVIERTVVISLSA